MIINKENISVQMHDTSITGIRYKLIVKLGKTPKNKGMEVLDTGNNLYRAIGFQYTYNPEYQGRGKSTVLVYYFNDSGYANRLAKWLTGVELDSESMQKQLIEREKRMKNEGYPAFDNQYLRIA